MGKYQRTKGHNFERLVAKMFRRWWPEARRGYQYRDGAEAPDVVGTPFWVECKNHKKILPSEIDHWLDFETVRLIIVYKQYKNINVAMRAMALAGLESVAHYTDRDKVTIDKYHNAIIPWAYFSDLLDYAYGVAAIDLGGGARRL
jgi:hypothetical protein